MKTFFQPRMLRTLLAALAISPLPAFAAGPANPLSAKELAARLSTLQQDGSSYIRLRLEVKQPAGTTALQIQIRQLRTKASTNVIYQILWPKERKGEAVLLTSIRNESPKGTLFVPPETTTVIGSSQMKEPLFDSDLCYADIIENFFAWDSQTILGEEMIGRVNCRILESKPGGGQSIYTRVRSWVDPERLVPLRVEKFFSSAEPARRIETTRVSREDDGHHIPAGLSVQGPRKNSVTTLEGSRLNTSVNYEAGDFTVEGLKALKPPDPAGAGAKD